MADRAGREYVETLVIGGGQAGLVMGYQLSRRGLPYKIVDANDRDRGRVAQPVGLTPAVHPQPAQRASGDAVSRIHWGFPSKDEMGRLSRVLRSEVRYSGRDRSQGGETDPRRRSLRRDLRRSTIRGRQRGGCDVELATTSDSGVRVRTRSEDRPASRRRVPESRSTPGRRRPGRRSRQLGRRGRHRAGEDPQGVAVGANHRAIPFRPESVPARVLMPFIGRVIFHRVLTTSTPIGRRPAPSGCPPASLDPGQAQRPRCRGRGTGSSGHRCPGRAAATRGRPTCRRRQRRLVHGIPPRVLLDRPTGTRPARAESPSWGRRIGARALLHRSQVPLFGVLRTDPGRGPRRGLHRREDRRRP